MERYMAALGKSAMLSAVRHSSFRWYWLSTAFWATGRWMEVVALGWLVLQLTDSPLVLGLVMACRGIPMLLLGAFGGVLADRMDRRRLLLLAQVGLGLLALLMAVLIAAGLIQLWQAFATTLLAGAAIALSMPARQALLCDIVGTSNLLNATAMNRMAMDSTRIIGPALAGGVIVLWGTSGCFYLMGISYIAGGVAILMARGVKCPVDRGSSAWRNFIDGLSYIRSNRTVLLLLSIEVITDTFAFSYYSMLPLFARDILGVGATGLGFLLSASGVGALLGLVAVAMLGDYKHKGWLLLGACFLFGTMLAFFALSTWYPLSLALLVGAGGASAVYDTAMATALQIIVPDEIRGRVLGAYVLTWGAAPLGSAEAGAVANLIGANFAVAIGGAIVGVYALTVASRASGVRRLR